MLTLEEASARLWAAIRSPTDRQFVDVQACSGRFLSEAPLSSVDLPPFDNSAMDGWAVRSADVKTVPTCLTIQGRVAAGGVFSGTLLPGMAIRIFTGSPLPVGADAVVMQEDSQLVDSGKVQILDSAKPWENVRLRGEDVRIGAPLMPAGSRLGAAQIALLAATGLKLVPVRPPIRVGILPNGSELVSPGEVLPPGGIYESNGATLAELVTSAGAVVERHAPPPDDLTALTSALAHAFGSADVVITAGGASVGEHDLVKPAFEALGGTIEFWRVALKPGKPFFFGTLPPAPGAIPKYLFGVPGNPVSAFVTTILLVLPALRKLLGANDFSGTHHPAILAESVSNPEGRRHFMRVHCQKDGQVRSSGPQGSHLLSSLAHANALIDVPPHTQWPAGTSVQVLRWGT